MAESSLVCVYIFVMRNKGFDDCFMCKIFNSFRCHAVWNIHIQIRELKNISFSCLPPFRSTGKKEAEIKANCKGKGKNIYECEFNSAIVCNFLYSFIMFSRWWCCCCWCFFFLYIQHVCYYSIPVLGFLSLLWLKAMDTKNGIAFTKLNIPFYFSFKTEKHLSPLFSRISAYIQFGVLFVIPAPE